MMSGTPVRVLNSIKVDGIWGVANNPAEFWILGIKLADSILGKLLAFLAELLIKLLYKEL